MSDYRKDMQWCSGAVPTISPRIFEQCGNPLSPNSPELLPLCEKHLEVVTKEITRGLRAEVAEIKAALAKTRDEIADEITTEWADRRDAIQAKAQEARSKRSRVYFMRCGKYIKIGTSTNIHRRLASIQKSGGVLMPAGLDFPSTELVAAIHGDHRRERDLHAKFSHLHHTGEWFTEAPELTEYINELKEAGDASSAA